MHFNFKLISALLLTVPFTLADVNGKCTGRNGICISTSNCDKYGGQKFTGKCPKDPNNIKCCDNIPCTADDGRRGSCVFTDQCSGDTISGKCPGSTNFKCCVPKKNNDPIGTACSYDGLSGTCQYTNNCSGFRVSGKCPGGSNIQCCLPKNSCKYNNQNGQCIPEDQCSTKNTVTGLCKGGKSIKCCLPKGSDSGNKKFKYFTISELTYSATAVAKNIDNTPSSSELKSLEYLIINCLDPIRERFGEPIRVTSGFRSKALNDAISNSSKTSQHMLGEAADLQPAGKKSIEDLRRTIAEFGNFDQLIFERDGTKRWAHVSCTSRQKRKTIGYINVSDKKSKYTNITNNWKNYLSK